MNATVCIPTWNGEKYIAETLRSVLAQTHEDFECIVVDDGSSDRTLEIVRSFRDDRLQCHSNPKQLGIAANYNRCLELARGEFICVFQQDDLMTPDNLRRKLAVLTANPEMSFVFSNALLLTTEDGPPTVGCYAPSDRILDGNAQFYELLLGENHICNPSVVARRRKLIDVGGYDTQADYTCDYEIWMKLSVNHRVGFLAEPLIAYRWHDANSSHRFGPDHRTKQIEQARRSALEHYRGSMGANADLLSLAMEKIFKAEQCAAALDRGRAWLETQVGNWRREAEKAIRDRNECEQRLSQELLECTRELQRLKKSRIRRWASQVQSLLNLRRQASP